MTHKNEERVETYVEDSTRDDADHSKGSIALQTQLIVECQRAGQKRRAKEHNTKILPSVRQDRWCGTQQ